MPIMIIVALIASFLFLVLVYYLYRIYKYSYLPRYANAYGMEHYKDLTVDFRSQVLGIYYGDFSKGIRAFHFDEGNIVQLEVNGQLHYNPCQVAEYALLFNDWFSKSGDEQEKEVFRLHLNWLMDHANQESDRASWDYLYNSGPEKAPWQSSISQGMAISALLRGYQLFGHRPYLEMAEKSFRYLDQPVAMGGFRFTDSQYKLWYEEDNFQHHILNGHLYALYGVYDLIRVTGDDYYRQCFELGSQTVMDRIDDFDMGFNTRYDKFNPYPANNAYHYTHIIQFEIMYGITGHTFYKEYAQKFRDYHNMRKYRIKTYIYIVRRVFQDKISKVFK